MQLPSFVINKTSKLALTIIMFATFGSGLMAQANIHFGLKAVPGVYWLKTTTDHVTPNASFGFGYGAMLEFGLTDNYYIVTGLDVVAAGANYSQDSLYASGNAKKTTTSNNHIQYLQVPVFLKMKTNAIGMIKYFGQFGLGTGLAISNNNTWDKTNIPATSGTDKTTGNLFALREALLIGLGLEYNLSGSTSLVTSISYDNGFTPVLRDKVGTERIIKSFANFKRGNLNGWDIILNVLLIV